MSYVEEQSYMEMITALENFKKQVETQCEIMEKAGQDCMDNMEADENAQKTNEKLTNSVKAIRENYDTITKIAKALEEELEKVRRLRMKMEATENN